MEYIVKYSKLLFTFFLILFTYSYAQGIVSKVIANSEVHLSLNNPIGSSSKYHYAIGETLILYVDTKRDGYLYIINVEADNQSFLLFPNDVNLQDSYLHAGEHMFPPKEANYAFHITEKTPIGSHKIFALVSSDPLNQIELSELKAELATQQRTSLLQHNDVVWAYTNFYVDSNSSSNATQNVPSTSVPSTSVPSDSQVSSNPTNNQVNSSPIAGLIVNSSPNGASVLFNDQLRGQTPLSFSEELGEHKVKLELNGYQPYETEITLIANQSTVLDATLTSVTNQQQSPTLSLSPSSPPQTNFGALVINSSPSGATIILNGQAFGQTPFNSSVTAGVYVIKLQTTGYSSLEKTIEILPSQTLEINEILTPESPASYPQTNHSPNPSPPQTPQTTNVPSTSNRASSSNTSSTSIAEGLLDVPNLSVSPYPNSSIVSQRNAASYFEAVFETNDTIQQTFSHFDEQLVNNGLKRRFQHSFFDIENNIYNVVYTLSTGQRITMILSHQQSKRLLELVFEGPEQASR